MITRGLPSWLLGCRPRWDQSSKTSLSISSACRSNLKTAVGVLEPGFGPNCGCQKIVLNIKFSGAHHIFCLFHRLLSGTPLFIYFLRSISIPAHSSHISDTAITLNEYSLMLLKFAYRLLLFKWIIDSDVAKVWLYCSYWQLLIMLQRKFLFQSMEHINAANDIFKWTGKKSVCRLNK